jgi:hypothetical protein
LPFFLDQVMVFSKIDYAFLIEKKGKLTHALESSIAYWHHLDIAWPQQEPTKGVNKL